MKIITEGKKCTAGAVLLNIQTMKRLFTGFLAFVLILGLFVGTARADEQDELSYYVEPHYCSKCSALLDKQAAYQAAMAAVHVKSEI